MEVRRSSQRSQRSDEAHRGQREVTDVRETHRGQREFISISESKRKLTDVRPNPQRSD